MMFQAWRMNVYVSDVDFRFYRIAVPEELHVLVPDVAESQRCTCTCQMLYCFMLQALRVARACVGCCISSCCRPSELHVHMLDVYCIMLHALRVARARAGCCIVSCCMPSELHVHVLDVVLYHVAGPQSCT
jgi:hypothetical protein